MHSKMINKNKLICIQSMKSILKAQLHKNELDAHNKDIKLQVNDNPSSRKTKSQKNSPNKDGKSRKQTRGKSSKSKKHMVESSPTTNTVNLRESQGQLKNNKLGKKPLLQNNKSFNLSDKNNDM